jgi:hypothetical protein
MRRRAVLSLSLLVLTGLVLGACGVTPHTSDRTAARPVDETGGGQFPVSRSKPIPIRAGAFVRGFNAKDVRVRAERAIASENAKARFKGWLQGIYFYPSGVGAGTFEERPFPCDRSRVAETGLESVLRDSRYWFDAPFYMPAGTYETSFPFGLTCDGAAFLVERDYEVRPTGGPLMISLTRQSFFVGFPVSRDRLETTLINGRPAVLVRPLITEGMGGSAVLVRVPLGLLRIQSDALPIDELIRIARSMVR